MCALSWSVAKIILSCTVSTTSEFEKINILRSFLNNVRGNKIIVNGLEISGRCWRYEVYIHIIAHSISKEDKPGNIRRRWGNNIRNKLGNKRLDIFG